jgi:hypothetical protein
LVLPSGLAIPFKTAAAHLLRFFRKEYDYYDRILDRSPDRIEPIDVLATVAMNSFVNNATLVRTVHLGLAGRCDAILPHIPLDADLLTFDPSLGEFERLIDAGVQATKVLVPVATKVLHRKRRNFIPMLDNILIAHYLNAAGRPDLREASPDKRRAAAAAVETLRGFREDLRASAAEVGSLRWKLADAGFALTPDRILEVLVWTEVEPQGYYRKGEGSVSL